MSEPSYDGPVSIWCPGMFLDLAYFRKQMKDGLEFQTLEKAVLGIELSRYYPPSSGNEGCYRTFRAHLADLAAEYPQLRALEEKTQELLRREHLPGASAEMLGEYCLAEQDRETLPLREVYENTAFQLLRRGELTKGLEKHIFERALATETCARWFGLGRKVNELLSEDEVEEALGVVEDRKIRAALLTSLVDRGHSRKALALFDVHCRSEKKALFQSLARISSHEGRTVSAAEAAFWLAILEEDPRYAFSRGAGRVTREPGQFLFLREPLREYFFKHVYQHSGEFLLSSQPALPVTLLRMILALEEDFDLKVWEPAAQYGGYQIIDIDYQNGFKCGDRTGQNFPVSEFAVAQFRERGMELPGLVPRSIPVPPRDPRDR